MSTITCIVGTTGSGKTKLALMLAAKEPSVIISADSRQVYRGMDIVTGKDHPKENVIHGINLVNPDQACSVSVWYDAVQPVIKQAQIEGKSIIVVGGTGLYVEAIVSGIPTMNIPINQELRTSLESVSKTALQTQLQAFDPIKYANMNHSDQNNPRRLIRAIEIFLAKESPITHTQKVDARIIGLYYQELGKQKEVIKKRVMDRIDKGAIQETKDLLNRYSDNLSSLSALGYKSLSEYINATLTKSEMIEAWTQAELQYVKRQLTYFRKKNVHWYDRDRMSIEEIYEHVSS
jgi:tRNA dimethylallyltransferase